MVGGWAMAGQAAAFDVGKAAQHAGTDSAAGRKGAALTVVEGSADQERAAQVTLRSMP